MVRLVNRGHQHKALVHLKDVTVSVSFWGDPVVRVIREEIGDAKTIGLEIPGVGETLLRMQLEFHSSTALVPQCDAFHL